MEATFSFSWRGLAKDLKLLRADDSRPAEFDTTRLNTKCCGISLSYLEQFAKCLQKIPRLPTAVTTAWVMRHVIQPALLKLDSKCSRSVRNDRLGLHKDVVLS